LKGVFFNNLFLLLSLNSTDGSPLEK